LAAAGQNGATRLRHGRLFTARCCLIVFTELPSALIRFRLPLSALASKRLTPLDAAELRSRFQGQLLQYRLVRHQAIANSRFATEGFAPGVATVADQLGAAVEGAEKLQTEIVKALQDLDEEQRQESSQSAEAIAVEAMLLPSHEQKRSALIGDLSEIANTILIERGEHPVFTPKKYGAIVGRLALRTTRQARGFELTFDPSTCHRLHELGRMLGVLALTKPVEGCKYWGSVFGTHPGVQ
jgi:hypothetical protein